MKKPLRSRLERRGFAFSSPLRGEVQLLQRMDTETYGTDEVLWGEYLIEIFLRQDTMLEDQIVDTTTGL